MRTVTLATLVCLLAAAACSGSDSSATGDGGGGGPGGGDDGSASSGDDGSTSGADDGSASSGDSGGSKKDGGSKGDANCVFPCRDWNAEPAIAVIPHASELYAVSDVHGGYDRLIPLLTQVGLIPSAPASPGAATWSGGNKVLVMLGDTFDKGPKGLEVIELMMALQPSARAQGGDAILLLGNHEGEFFADPNNSKATASDGLDVELQSMQISPAAIANGSDPRGAWLLHRPVGAMVGKYFFSHAGDTGGKTVAQLESLFESTIPKGFSDPSLTGTNSILESRGWYTGNTAQTNATALGALHIVFGHDPHALGAQGAIQTASSGLLFRIDCGMSPDVNYSKGALFHVKVVGSNDVIEEIDPAPASPTQLYSGPTGL